MDFAVDFLYRKYETENVWGHSLWPQNKEGNLWVLDQNFKRQVKNNIAKFVGDDFMFELNDEEVENLSRCKNFTLNVGRGSNTKYKHYVFTEQGLYILLKIME